MTDEDGDALAMDITPQVNVYSTMLKHKHKHSQIVVDDGIQTYIQEKTTYEDKQENTRSVH